MTIEEAAALIRVAIEHIEKQGFMLVADVDLPAPKGNGPKKQVLVDTVGEQFFVIEQLP